jgi:hypothetical protein
LIGRDGRKGEGVEWKAREKDGRWRGTMKMAQSRKVPVNEAGKFS